MPVRNPVAQSCENDGVHVAYPGSQRAFRLRVVPTRANRAACGPGELRFAVLGLASVGCRNGKAAGACLGDAIARVPFLEEMLESKAVFPKERYHKAARAAQNAGAFSTRSEEMGGPTSGTA